MLEGVWLRGALGAVVMVVLTLAGAATADSPASRPVRLTGVAFPGDDSLFPPAHESGAVDSPPSGVAGIREQTGIADNQPVSPAVPAAVAQTADRQLDPLIAWQKGPFRIVHYGIGWLHASYDTSRTVSGPFVLFVHSEDTQGEPSFSVSARATRLGFLIDGPEIRGGRSGGRIEFDFHGFALTENRTGVLLRHAYGEFYRDGWRILGGQTWDLISPLWPNVLNYTVAWAAGNIGYRRAQVRVERTFEADDGSKWLLQSSINQTIVSDFVGAPDIQGEDAGWPTIMGRIGYVGPDVYGTGKPVQFGVSGHIAQHGTDFRNPPVEDDRRFLSWSFNVDVRYPFSERCGFQGEFFMGQALGTFLGGINQGIDPVEREAIRAMGGWVEFWLYWTPILHTHVGFGIDDPNDDDLSVGRRTQNHFYFANLIWNVSPELEVGIELSWWETRYKGLAPGEAFRVEGAMRYHF